VNASIALKIKTATLPSPSITIPNHPKPSQTIPEPVRLPMQTLKDTRVGNMAIWRFKYGDINMNINAEQHCTPHGLRVLQPAPTTQQAEGESKTKPNLGSSPSNHITQH
jgi:hypothetical protein